MCSFTRHSAPCIAAVAVLLTCISLFFYMVLFFFFTCLLLLVSTNIFSTPSNKTLVVNETVENQPKEVEVEVEVASSTMLLQNKQESREEDLYNEVHEIFRSSDSDEFDELSDGSISDEESLIEIALPSGLYVSPKFKLPAGFSAETILFKQHGLMELLAEINEENLIEIDISMGIIKCSRVEIKA